MDRMLRGCVLVWAWLASWLQSAHAGSSTLSPYALVADAGSTGTRVYLFHLDESAPGAPNVEITDMGKGPALSTFQDTPQQAAAAVTAQLAKAKALIPESQHASVPVSIFATAGMRLVDLKKAEAIYSGLRTSLLDGDFPFKRDGLQA